MRGYLKEESYKDYRDEELVRIAQAGDDAVQDWLVQRNIGIQRLMLLACRRLNCCNHLAVCADAEKTGKIY